MGKSMLFALHVGTEGLARIPRSQEGKCCCSALRTQKLEVLKTGETVYQVRPVTEVLFQANLVSARNGKMRNEDEHCSVLRGRRIEFNKVTCFP